MKYLMALLLIPSLVAGPWDRYPKSVRKLLEKPWTGPAVLSLRDGKNVGGQIVRVTDEYVTILERRTCRHIELSELSRVARSKPQGDGEDGIIAAIILMPLAFPYLVASWIHPDPLAGAWKSETQDSRTLVIDFGYGDVKVEEATLAEGRYRFDGSALYLDDGSGPATLQCAPSGDQIRAGTLRLFSQWSEAAAPPAVGRWATRPIPGQPRTSWDLRADGTFRKEVATPILQSRFRRSGRRIKLASGEEWTFRRAHGHLFITSGGVTTEYKPRHYR